MLLLPIVILWVVFVIVLSVDERGGRLFLLLVPIYEDRANSQRPETRRLLNFD